MKIGILTLPLHTNYGGILQAYALQTVLERMGHEVVVIDTHDIRPNPPFHVLLKRFIKKILGRKIRVFEEHRYNAMFPIISQYTQPFIEEYIHRRVVNSLFDLQNTDFDALVVGSDQIWRPMYFTSLFNTSIKNAYLDFACKWNIKRIAYAASFGTDNWEYSIKQTKICGELLRLFDYVSVRERSGIQLCRNNFNVDAIHVLDPTMLLDAADYIRLFEVSNTPKSSGTLLSYILDTTPDKQKLIEKITIKKGYIPFCVNSRIEEWDAPIQECIQPPVEEWLRGFYDAEFVVTDSFHACVFSILFNKPFIVIGNEGRGIARFESLLKTFGLEERLVITNNLDLPSSIFSPPNALNMISDLRDISYKFLDKINN